MSEDCRCFGFRWQPRNVFPAKLIKCTQHSPCIFPIFHIARLVISCAFPWSIFTPSHNNLSPKYIHHPGFAFIFLLSPLPVSHSLIGVYSTFWVVEGIEWQDVGPNSGLLWLACSVTGGNSFLLIQFSMCSFINGSETYKEGLSCGS